MANEEQLAILKQGAACGTSGESTTWKELIPDFRHAYLAHLISAA